MILTHRVAFADILYHHTLDRSCYDNGGLTASRIGERRSGELWTPTINAVR